MGFEPVNEGFADPSSDIKREYIVTTMISGSVHINDFDCINLLNLAVSPIGVTIENETIVTSEDTPL